jgi:hypothetical protein
MSRILVLKKVVTQTFTVYYKEIALIDSVNPPRPRVHGPFPQDERFEAF